MNEPEVHRPDVWSDVVELFGSMDRQAIPTIGSWLETRADLLLDGWRRRHPGVPVVVSSWHPGLVGHPAAIDAHRPSVGDARITVAREHGFSRWAEVVAAGARRFDPAFETTVDLLLAGRATTVATTLADDPELVTARSPFGHRATLLHYLAANGVETERQVTPLNGAELIRLLLGAGADPDATMDVYGGRFTTRQLAESSANPADAGVLDAMLRALASS